MSDIEEVTRPTSLDNFICSDEIKNHIKTRIEATKMRGKTFPNTLITGGSGCGKTTIANIIANELHVRIKTLMGPSIDSVDDVTDAFVGMNDGDILFIDEFHAMKKAHQEILYTAMEQKFVPKKIDSIVFPYKIKDVCIMAATNESSNLPDPFVSRCKFKLHFTNYADVHLSEIIKVDMRLTSNLTITDSAALTFAAVCRGIPRVAIGNLEELIDYSIVNNISNVGDTEVLNALNYMNIDKFGLTQVDRRIMFALFKARKLSISSLSSMVGQSEDIIEKQYEPYLLIKGYMMRSSGGRRLTPDGWQMVADGVIKEV